MPATLAIRNHPHPNPSTHHEYVVTSKGEGTRLAVARLRDSLKPFHLHFFPRLRSTSDHAAALRKRGELFAPAIVVTSHQTKGRGRGKNTWWSNRGCLTVTFVFAIDERLSPPQIPLLAGLAVRDAVVELTGENEIELKWPNDLVFRGKKLAGLLCERMDKADLIGLGLNVNVPANAPPKRLRHEVTSLSQITGKTFDMTQALAVVARHLHRTLSRSYERAFSEALREYDRHHALLGRRVTVVDHDQTFTGRCEGLDRRGRLVLVDRGKMHHVIAGEVRLI